MKQLITTYPILSALVILGILAIVYYLVKNKTNGNKTASNTEPDTMVRETTVPEQMPQSNQTSNGNLIGNLSAMSNMMGMQTTNGGTDTGTSNMRVSPVKVH